jgi:uncharacterized protein (TIGR03435 family)
MAAAVAGDTKLERLQSILEDRFHLVLRRQTREGAVYFLTAAKDRKKLRHSSCSENQCGNVRRGLDRAKSNPFIHRSAYVEFVRSCVCQHRGQLSSVRIHFRTLGIAERIHGGNTRVAAM